jgi:sialate O-acetylesterase
MKSMRFARVFALAAICLLSPGVGSAANNPPATLKLGALFCDHMILQRELELPVWGWSAPGATITVEFADQKQQTKAGQDGKWLVKLKPLKASAVAAEMVVSDSGGGKLVIKNVLVGEVWICAGQSNMQYGWGKESLPIFNWGGSSDLAAWVPEARTKPIRGYAVDVDVALTPLDKCKGSWSTDVSGSAVAFGFSYRLYQQLQVPVGVIVTCWGSSCIEGWMPRELTAQLPHFKNMMEKFDADADTLNRVRAAAGHCNPNGNVFERQQPNILYNAMLHPLIPGAARGLVWYQGEANAGQPAEYARSLPVWVKRLREEWGRDDFQVLVVMLPGYGDESWARFRKAQLGILDLPHTAVANTIDLGDAKNIHPPDKAPIAERLALLARRDVYGEKLEAQGPVFKRARVEGDRLVLEFDHAGGLKTRDGAAPTAFQLAGSDKAWRPATALIKGNTVELVADGLAVPAFVQYAFSGKPSVNLVNGANLPAYPFTTEGESR